MSNRTVFIDTSLSGYETLAAHYDASLFNIVYLTDPLTGYLQVQDYLTTNNIGTADINVVSASSSLNGLFTGRIVFVDPRATDYQTLIAGIDANATVVVLDANSDGVKQIHDYLDNNTGLVSAVDIITGGGFSSLDVVSHGDTGVLYLGSTVLTSDNMSQYTDLLTDIGNQLSDHGDILLYGCDVAAGDIGQQFINQLADATGADVAASTDLTGAATLGGDWALEATNDGGVIETNAFLVEEYTEILAANAAISSITIPSGGGDNKFVTGENIDITVNFDKAVQVSGIPTLTLNVGGVNKVVNFFSGSSTSTLTFRYTVVSGDTDANGINIAANSLALNGGTISTGSNVAILLHAAISDQSNALVNPPASTPTISSITIPSGGSDSTFKATDQVDVTVNFSEAVTVTGTPTLTLNVGGVNKVVDLFSGSGTSTLTFRYTVASGDTDTDGISIAADSLALNGGTIKNSFGTNVVLTHTAVGEQNQALVDTTIAAASVTLTTDSGDNNADGLTNDASLIFSTLEGDATRVITVDGNIVGSYDPSLADGSHTVSIADNDGAGNTSSDSVTFTLDTTIAAASVTLTTDSGDNNADGLTNDASLIFSTLEGDATRVITVDGNIVGSYDPSLADGSHTVSIADTDGAGNTSSDSVTFTLDTTNPDATSTSASSDEDTTITVKLSGTDTGGSGISQYKITELPAQGTLYTDSELLSAVTDDTLYSSNTFYFKPTANYNGADSFKFSVTDMAGNTDLTPATVSITVNPVNDIPETSPISLSTVENALVLVPVIPEYAYDVDNDNLSIAGLGSISFAWALDSTSTTLTNPVTKLPVSMSSLTATTAISTDLKTFTITPGAELDWMTSDQKIVATFNYTVKDPSLTTSTNPITLTIWGSTADRGKTLIGSNGADTMTGTASEDVLQGQNGNDTISGGDKTDALYGGNGDDTVSGGNGVDYVYGDNGNDKLYGDADNDVLFGGKGNDSLWGGTGYDHFVFEPQMGSDIIKDFNAGDVFHFVDMNLNTVNPATFVNNYVTDLGNDLLISMPGGLVAIIGVANPHDLDAAFSFVMPS